MTLTTPEVVGLIQSVLVWVALSYGLGRTYSDIGTSDGSSMAKVGFLISPAVRSCCKILLIESTALTLLHRFVPDGDVPDKMLRHSPLPKNVQRQHEKTSVDVRHPGRDLWLMVLGIHPSTYH